MALHKPGRSRLPELLKRKRLKPIDLARFLSVSPSFISQVISGKRFFSYEIAGKASQILECSMEDLHEWNE